MSSFLSQWTDYLLSLQNITHQDIQKYFKHYKKLKLFVIGCSSFMMLRFISLKIHRKYKHYPPGPVGLPCLGFIPQRLLFLKYGFERYDFNNLAKVYGPILMFYGAFGAPPMVIINSASLSRKILKLKANNHKNDKHKTSHIFNRGHAKTELNMMANDDNELNFAGLDYKEWISRRKLAQNSLFAMCTGSFVTNIMDEIMAKTIMPTINECIDNERLFYPKKLFAFCAFNTIFYSSFGRSSNLNDVDGLELRSLIDLSFSKVTDVKLQTWNKLESLRPILPKPTEILEIRSKRCQLIRKLIKDREESDEYDEKNPTSYIDHMIAAEKVGEMTRSQMEADIGALFSAGTDTTSSALEHAIVYAAKYQDIQEKVRSELLETMVSMKFDINKLSKLTLFRAFIKEVLRIGSVVPIGVLHSASGIIKIEHENKEYVIPNNSIVTYNVSAVHWNLNNDEEWLDNPTEIVLENWINSKNGRFKMHDSDLTFGYGHRDCVGKTLAEKELFMIIGNLLLNYKFSFENQSNPPEIKHSAKAVHTIYPEIGIKVERLIQN